MVPEKVLKIVVGYKSKDYFPIGRIPQEKLQNARDVYFLDPDDEAVALIDATIFGSAKKGMVIGINGVYWRNEDGEDTGPHFISWDRLAVGKKSITTAFSGVALGAEGKFDLTSCQMDKKLLVKLLSELVSLHRQSPIDDAPVDERTLMPGARELFVARAALRDANAKVLDVENRLALIDAKKPPSYWIDGWRGVLVELFAWPIAFLVYFLFAGLHWLIGLIAGLLALGVYSNLMGARGRKKLQPGLASLIAQRDQIQERLLRMAQGVVPEIHGLGMATLEDVMVKTSAGGLGVKETRRLLEGEVREGRLEKISLFEGKILYKSHSPQADKYETTELTID